MAEEFKHWNTVGKFELFIREFEGEYEIRVYDEDQLVLELSSSCELLKSTVLKVF